MINNHFFYIMTKTEIENLIKLYEIEIIKNDIEFKKGYYHIYFNNPNLPQKNNNDRKKLNELKAMLKEKNREGE